jgi:endonuclease-3
MTPKTKAKKCVEALEREYPDAGCTLDYIDPHQLLVSVRLAAQCTDARVNIVTRDLFVRYPSAQAFAEADVAELEEMVRPCGLGHTKARDIVAMSQMVMERFGGQAPDNMEDLLTLPGVGRKSANLILGDVFHKPAVVVDTHCIRITNLLGLSEGKNPAVVEKQLLAVLDPAKSNDFCHRLVVHGRAVCVARRPKCDSCVMSEWCDYAKNL